MADEEKVEGEETQTETENNATAEGGDSTAGKGEASDKGGTVDYEKQYKELQGEYTRSQQTTAELTRRLEAIEKGKSGQAEPEAEVELGDEDFVDRKTVNKLIDDKVQKGINAYTQQAAARYFKKTYPGYVKYEAVIAGIMRHPKSPEKLQGATYEDRIDAAIEEFDALAEETKKEAQAKAEADQKAKEDAKKKASGLTSSSTPASKGDDSEESDEDELKSERTRQAKRSGLA